MILSTLRSLLLRQRPLILYTAAWTALLTATVAAASFSPEIAFVWAVSSSSPFARTCVGGGGCSGGGELVRVPLGGPAGEVVCVPAQLLGRWKAVDFLVPPLFAALVVTASGCFVRAVGLWENSVEEF